MKIPSNRLKLVLSAALFNLLFEYSARGYKELASRPLFTLALFGIYVTYFLMLEDLIVRYRLTNYQIFLVAFLYGLFPTAYLTGNLFNDEIYWGSYVCGVNLGTVIIVGVLAWGVVQGMVTLYLANRISPRDWNHPKLGWIGWIACTIYQLGIMAWAFGNPNRPRPELLSYLSLGVLSLIAAGLLYVSLRTRRGKAQPFQRSTVMDMLALASVVIFLILGTFFVSEDTIVTSQPLNRLAVTLENFWVMICGLVFFVFRSWKQDDVTV